MIPEVESIEGVTYHRVYRGIFGPVGSREHSARGAASMDKEDAGGLYERAYHLYLKTGFAFYVACVAANIINSYDLDVIIERETAFGAGALASVMCRRPMVLEMIGPRFSSLSARQC